MRKFGSVMFADWRAARARCVFESVDCLVELVAGAACVDECVLDDCTKTCREFG